MRQYLKRVNMTVKNKSDFCTWTNKGSKLFPNMFTVSCNGHCIDPIKTKLPIRCPFCLKPIKWGVKGEKK